MFSLYTFYKMEYTEIQALKHIAWLYVRKLVWVCNDENTCKPMRAFGVLILFGSLTSSAKHSDPHLDRKQLKRFKKKKTAKPERSLNDFRSPPNSLLWDWWQTENLGE